VVDGATEVSQDMLDEIRAQIVWSMHVETHLVHCIWDAMLCERQVLKCTGDAVIE
jgi:hypothetical protein